MKRILHLTHTDINTDSRILKEMLAISNDASKVLGIGVNIDEGSKSVNQQYPFDIVSVSLFSRKLTFFPKVIRHSLTLLELMFKVILKSILFKPDLIHCHDTVVLPIGVITKFFCNAKLVYDAHELESNKNGTTKTMSWLTYNAEKIMWPKIDGLIVVSPSINKWYAENLGLKESEVILNSPVIDEKSREIKKNNYLRERFNISDDKKVFLYIGILGKGRGIELLCEVFKSSDIKSAIVFLGYGEFRDMLHTLSLEYDNIHLHDAVPHNQVVTISQSADYGMCLVENVSLSDYYCLPNKFFEYCLAGIPVISSKFPDLIEVIDYYNLGQYSDLNVNSVYNTVKYIESENLTFSIDTESLYPLSWDCQADKLRTMYKKLLA
ncbi:glycosyltransferase family 4 protein [Vibrio cholerae]|uniref:glycosyltransferase n=1 Tax=Vibrio cholerae TaxID=666 RepID=UPI001159FC61|nr:glycosyltransferase [Vibrio cholerae]TQP09338.1 glycosyltransferase family 4 protein [Vibrio cholerae]TQP71487.1 glycosyltransferase family 4 protein [Vibrio cholerae]TQQ04634.1 glycosyltransferase family 4 protein [Vibrio cholerae]TQQ71584.1 glycosyltransferase family 4 protein [Vibrio cholerae]